MKDSFSEVFEGKDRILFVFAHPDDAEIYCGGLIARLVEAGKKVQLLKMTTGNKGSRDTNIGEKELAETRENEDSRALEILGLTKDNSVNLNLGDGAVENNLHTIEKLVREIRQFKPDLVVTHNPENKIIRVGEGENYVNHRDHINTATAVIDACYPYSRDTLFFPDQLKDGLECHSVSEFFFVDSWNHEDTIYIEVTDQIEKRTSAIAAHSSQYSSEAAKSSTDFFAHEEKGKRFEQFRYVEAD